MSKQRTNIGEDLPSFGDRFGSILLKKSVANDLVQGRSLGADRDTDCAAVYLVFVAAGCCGFCLRLSFG